jgi:hypothetical protein
MDPVNQNFQVLDHFVVHTESRSLVMYFGNDDPVVIPSSISCISPFFMFWGRFVPTLEFALPSSVRELGESAFESCSFHDVRCIPASVEIIRANCFRKCRYLRFVGFESGSKLAEIEDSAFSDCMSLQTMTIPASVRRIGNQCFSNCKSLTQIQFESLSQLDEIGDFGECFLEWIDIPDSVHAIGLLPLAREKSSCAVTFGKESQLAVVSGVDDTEAAVSRRGFARHSEGALRRSRDFATINSEQ